MTWWLSRKRIMRGDFSLFDNEGTPGEHEASSEYATLGTELRRAKTIGKNRAIHRKIKTEANKNNPAIAAHYKRRNRKP